MEFLKELKESNLYKATNKPVSRTLSDRRYRLTVYVPKEQEEVYIEFRKYCQENKIHCNSLVISLINKFLKKL